MRRRSLLASLAAGGFAAVAGCTSLASDDDPVEETPNDYDLLATQRVYVAPDVSLTLPGDVPQVDDPGDANVVVLPGTTGVGSETGIDWLASGTGVAFVGSEGQATLVEWMESDAYDETFDSNAVAVGSPPPDFLVAFGIERQYVSKHGFTWNDTSDPADDRYLAALEEAIGDAGKA